MLKGCAGVEDRQVILNSLVGTLNKTKRGLNIIDIIYDDIWETVRIVYVDGYVYEECVGRPNGLDLIERVIRIVNKKERE